MKTFVNLTPHAVDIYTRDGYIQHVEPSGQLARLVETREQCDDIDNIAVSRAEYGEIEGLPEPQKGVIYIVSALTLSQCQHREDVFAPGPAVRDDKGRIIGCEGLSAPNSQIIRSPSGFRAEASQRGIRLYDDYFVEDDGTERSCLVLVASDSIEGPKKRSVLVWGRPWLEDVLVPIEVVHDLLNYYESGGQETRDTKRAFQRLEYAYMQAKRNPPVRKGH